MLRTQLWFRVRLRAVVVATCTILCAAGGAQTFEFPDFSADVVTHFSGGRGNEADGKGRFFTSKGRVRTETYRGDTLSGVMITDMRNQTALRLMPQRKVAMDLSATFKAAQQSMNAMVQKPVDPANPCAALPGMTCTKLGSEAVDGRTTQKWELKDKNGKPLYLWTDPALHFALKVQGQGYSSEFHNVKVGPQPDNLFQVPPDYRKMTAPAGVPETPP
jgi:hypothetical protein